MTAQHLIELVLEQSPLDDGAIAKLHLKNALDYFCEETLILRRKATLTLSTESRRHTITDPDDIIRIREISQDGTRLENTHQPSYLVDGNGFWYIEANTPLTMYIAQYSGTDDDDVPFPAGETFDMIYEAYATEFATDGAGAEDFQAEPEIPRRFHEALTYRACEKANYANPELRAYWHALWRDEIKKGKRHAKEMATNANWNVKVYTL